MDQKDKELNEAIDLYLQRESGPEPDLETIQAWREKRLSEHEIEAFLDEAVKHDAVVHQLASGSKHNRDVDEDVDAAWMRFQDLVEEDPPPASKESISPLWGWLAFAASLLITLPLLFMQLTPDPKPLDTLVSTPPLYNVFLSPTRTSDDEEARTLFEESDTAVLRLHLPAQEKGPFTVRVTQRDTRTIFKLQMDDAGDQALTLLIHREIFPEPGLYACRVLNANTGWESQEVLLRIP